MNFAYLVVPGMIIGLVVLIVALTSDNPDKIYIQKDKDDDDIDWGW